MNPLIIVVRGKTHFRTARKAAGILPATGLSEKFKTGNDTTKDSVFTAQFSLAANLLPVAEYLGSILPKYIDISLFLDERFENPFCVFITLKDHGELFPGGMKSVFFRTAGIFFQNFSFDMPWGRGNEGFGRKHLFPRRIDPFTAIHRFSMAGLKQANRVETKMCKKFFLRHTTQAVFEETGHYMLNCNRKPIRFFSFQSSEKARSWCHANHLYAHCERLRWKMSQTLITFVITFLPMDAEPGFSSGYSTS